MITEFSGPYRFLSNFWMVPIKIGVLTFASVEHAYQAAKSLDPEDWYAIQRCESAAHAKRAGQKVKLRPDWDDVKIDAMRQLCIAKFTQHSELTHLLVETGDQELIEGNTWGDTFWGVCNGVGENHLGKILMHIRSQL